MAWSGDRKAAVAAGGCLLAVAAVAVVLLVMVPDVADLEDDRIEWSGYRATPQGIDVLLTTGPCDEVGEAEAEQHDDRVVVSLRGAMSPDVCAALAVEHRVPVALYAPLGDRAVYDAHCLDRVPEADATSCRRSLRSDTGPPPD